MFRSKHLEIICARLGIALLHAKPYQPAGKGKIERFLLRVRQQFLCTVEAAEFNDIKAFNVSFRAWVEGEYHRTPHYGLGGQITPLDQWAMKGEEVRYVEPGVDLQDLFLFEVQRKVRKDRTVQLRRRIYEVDAVLVGEVVTLRYDPGAGTTRPLKVVHQGRCAGAAVLVDLHVNARIKRAAPRQPIEYRNITSKQDR